MTLFLCFHRNMFAEMETVSLVWLYLVFCFFLLNQPTHEKDYIYTA